MSIKKMLFGAAAVSVVAVGLVSCGGKTAMSGNNGGGTMTTTTAAAGPRVYADVCEEAEATGSKIAQAKCETELARLGAEKDKIDADRKRAQSAANEEELLEDGRAMLKIPCLEQAMDFNSRGEFMAALGISAKVFSETDAVSSANDAAANDLTRRFVGVIQRMMEDVVSSGTTLSGKPFSESARDGAARVIGEKVINKLLLRDCMKFTKDGKGQGYVAYQVLKIPLKEANEQVAASVEEITNARVNKQMVLNSMDKQLSALKDQQQKDMQDAQQKYKEAMEQ